MQVFGGRVVGRSCWVEREGRPCRRFLGQEVVVNRQERCYIEILCWTDHNHRLGMSIARKALGMGPDH